jgi:Fur family transcriptional regulator, peroxide stress response regulator
MTEHVEQFIANCKEKGLSVTYQRMAVYKSLVESPIHPTADDIYNQVKIDHPTISLATVYKTLETLAENLLISKVTNLHDMARYDGQNDPHHHLVCIKCRKILDIHDDNLDGLSLSTQNNNGFKILDYRVQFDGICQECQNN